jgi:hypothetical protein
MEASAGGIIDVKTGLLILGGQATDPENLLGAAKAAARLDRGFIRAEGTLVFCHGGTLSTARHN